MNEQEQELLKGYEELSQENKKLFKEYLIFLIKQERSGNDGKTEKK